MIIIMEKLIVSSSPHIQSKTTTQSIMRDVLIALLPATIASVVLFGWKALVTILICVSGAVLAEYLFNIICKKAQTVTPSALFICRCFAVIFLIRNEKVPYIIMYLFKIECRKEGFVTSE